MSAKIVLTSSNTWLSGWMRPASAGASRSGSVTSMVSEASRASSAADFRMSRRAESAWVTLSLARLIAAPCVLRSSGDILPRVASSAEIEPFLPSAATRTASRADSSPAAAIWLRMLCSSVARSDTDQIFLQKAAGCDRPGAETSRPKRQAKARNFVPGGVELLNPLARRRHQRQAQRENSMIAKPILAGMAVILSFSAGPAVASICLGKSMTLDETIDAINATRRCERAMKLFEDCEYGTSGDIHLGAAVEKKCER